MFKNYMTIAWRNILQQKGFSLINIGGLAIGLSCCLLILMFIQDEFSYDRFHSKADRIYRVVASTSEDRVPTNANGSFGYGPLLKEEFPEVQDSVRIRKMGQGVKRYIGYKGKKFYEEWFFFAEPAIFTIFDFPLIQGNPTTALSEPNTIVITEEMAEKYFQNENPLGKIIEADPYNTGEIMHFRVTGIAANVPRNSHLHFDFLASYRSQKDDTHTFGGFWQHYTYVLLDAPSSAEAVTPGLYDFMERHFRKNPWYTIHLQPLLDIHLRSQLKSEVEPPGNMNTIYIFSIIAVLVLVIACINFINLTTARSVKRAKEVGLRKTFGAERGQLTRQFLCESLVFSVLAMVVAVGLTWLLLPVFNQLADKNISVGHFLDPLIIFILASLAVFVGFLAGIYPAFFLSSFRPVISLRSAAGSRSGRIMLRKGTVAIQFALSTGMIIATLITLKQMDYILTRNPGYDKEQIIAISLNKDIRSNYPALRRELLSSPCIENTSTSSLVPTRGSHHLSFKFENRPEWITQVVYYVDREFADTYGLKMVAGTPIKKEISRSGNTEYLISKRTVTEANYSSPREAVGKEVVLFDRYKGFVSGVVDDINIYSLHREPYPINYIITPISQHNYLSIRLVSSQIASGLEHISRVWQKLVPNYPLNYFLIDESFEMMHRGDQRMGEVFTVFSVLAILVACLGLFGLVVYTIEQRTREIGIRKALGARVSSIYLLLSRDFIKWVAIANIIAWPVTYWAMNRWLQNFAYRIHVVIDIFLLSGGIALVLALATVSFQSIKAARANPIDSLRYE
jgi:putative ABC transport system permease protein